MATDKLFFDVKATANPNIKSGVENYKEVWVKWSGGKVKLDSINQLASIATTINEILNNEPDYEIVMEWVRKIKRTHPLLDEEIKDLAIFKGISQSTGSTFNLHTPDTQTLKAIDWDRNKPICVRNVTKYKLRSDDHNLIENSYQSLNAGFVNNLSREYYNESSKPFLRGKNARNNDYHIVGDHYYYDDVLKPSLDNIKNELLEYLESASKLVVWLNRPKPTITTRRITRNREISTNPYSVTTSIRKLRQALLAGRTNRIDSTIEENRIQSPERALRTGLYGAQIAIAAVDEVTGDPNYNIGKEDILNEMFREYYSGYRNINVFVASFSGQGWFVPGPEFIQWSDSNSRQILSITNRSIPSQGIRPLLEEDEVLEEEEDVEVGTNIPLYVTPRSIRNITVEGNDVIVDLKGGGIQSVSTNIDLTGITPGGCANE